MLLRATRVLQQSYVHHANSVVQANQLLRAEKRFKDFEESVAQTNEHYQRQVSTPVLRVKLHLL
jgi:hypothetical protein